VPGFRPGHVPAGMIKKMYGRAVLVEEVEKLLNESLGRYIFDNNIPMLGSPLPKKSETEREWEEGKNFEFLYEIGLAPEFEVNIKGDKVPYYVLKVDDKMVDDDIADLRRRYGKFSNPEVSDESHILYGDFEELDETGGVKEGGNKTTTTVALEMVKDVLDRKKFIGLKNGDSVTFNPMQTFNNQTEVAAMLKVAKDSPALNADYKFTLKTINQVEKAELNQEFFDKIYGKDTVKNEEEFRAKVREGIAKMMEVESDRKLKKDLRNKISGELDIPLPDDFLKRMLRAEHKEKESISEEQFDHEYFHLAEDLRWSLVTNKIAKAQNLTVAEEEVKLAAKQLVYQQFAQYGMRDIEESKIEELATNYLKDEKHASNLERGVIDQKVFMYLKSASKLDPVELPYEAFVEKLREKTEHELEHHH
jgi:trigger factor